MKKYIATGFLTLAVLVSIGFATPTFAQTTDAAAQIQALLAQLKALQAQIAQLQGQPASTNACLSLSYNLYADQVDARTNGEVTKLQQFLAQDSSIYPAGLVTGYFGPMTETAVQRWQARNGVVSSGSPDTTGYGYVGPKTRAAMSCSNSTVYQPQTNTNTKPAVTQTSSNLTSNTLNIVSPRDTTVSVGGEVTIVYTIGSNIVAGDPAIVERTIIKANPSGRTTDVVNSTYIPVSQSGGTHSFEWVPNEPGEYQVKLTINHNNRSYTERSGVITAVGNTISESDLLTPTLSVSVSPTSITAGQSALLKWDSTNANRCGLQYGSSEESISVDGTKTVTPSQTTTYFVWCTNDPGTGTINREN